MSELDTLLNTYHNETLHTIAEAGGLETKVKGKKINKVELVALLRRSFFTPARVQNSLQKLNDREKAVLNRLRIRGDDVSTRLFKREIVRAGLATEAPESKQSYGSYKAYGAGGYEGSPHNKNSTIFEDVIARLTYYGLVFSKDIPTTYGATPKAQFHPGETLFIPTLIRPYLPKPEPLTSTTWQPTQVQHGDPQLFLRDVYLYWDFVRRNEVALLQNGGVGKRSLKAINQVLLVTDPLLEEVKREEETGRLFLLHLILEKLGLVWSKAGHLQPGDPKTTMAFWQKTLTEQVTMLFEAWLTIADGLAPGLEQGDLMPQVHTAHQVIIKFLKKDFTTWFEENEFLAELQAREGGFLFPERVQWETRRGYWYGRYISGSYYDSLAKYLKRLDELEAQFLTAVLEGILFPLGILDKGTNPATNPPSTVTTYQLSPLGRVVLGLDSATTIPPDTSGKLVIQPNFHLLAIGPVGLDLLARLDIFAVRQKVDRGVFEYTLTRESVYAAQQAGFAVEDIMQYLMKTSETELPQNVRRSLEEWGAHHERIVFRTHVNLLQSASADLLNTLLEKPEVGKLLARPITPTVTLVKKGQKKKLVDTLVTQGLFPAVSGADPSAANHSVLIQADGAVRSIHAVPSLHLNGRISRLAEETPNGWQLTEKSVQKVGGSRNKVLAMLEELKKLHRGRLPEQLTTRIKSWGGYYGTAAAENLTLIEFYDREALKELQQHPDLQPYLTLFPAGDRSLAVVQDDKLTQVKEALARLGVKVKEGIQVHSK